MKYSRLGIFSYIFFFIVFILLFRTLWTLSHTYTPDFSVFYQTAVDILRGSSVYTGKTIFTSFSYPLISGLFFVPFAFLPYQVSQTLFLFLNVIALLGISLIIPLILLNKRSLFLSLWIFAFSYLSFPTKFTLGMGQINIIAYFSLMLCLFMLRLESYRHVRITPLLVGFFFALAIILKPILAFLTLFFILQKQWKVLFMSFGLIIFTFLLGAIVDHKAVLDYVYYLQKVIPAVSKPVGKEIYYNQGLMSFIFRIIHQNIWRLVFSYAGIISIFLIGLYKVWKSKNILYKFSLLLCIIPILDTLSWQHHFVILIFPFCYVAFVFIKIKKWKSLFILLFSYLLVSTNIAHPEIFIRFPFSLILSNTFYGVFLLFIIMLIQFEDLQSIPETVKSSSVKVA